MRYKSWAERVVESDAIIIENSEGVKELQDLYQQLYDAFIGQTLVGGRSGYLGRYATCAIGTDVGLTETMGRPHNLEGSKRSFAMEHLCGSLLVKSIKLWEKDEFYGTTLSSRYQAFQEEVAALIPQVKEFLESEAEHAKESQGFEEVAKALGAVEGKLTALNEVLPPPSLQR